MPTRGELGVDLGDGPAATGRSCAYRLHEFSGRCQGGLCACTLGLMAAGLLSRGVEGHLGDEPALEHHVWPCVGQQRGDRAIRVAAAGDELLPLKGHPLPVVSVPSFPGADLLAQFVGAVNRPQPLEQVGQAGG